MDSMRQMLREIRIWIFCKVRYSYDDLGKLEGSPGTLEDYVNMDLFQAKSLELA